MSVVMGMLAPYWQQILGGLAAIVGILGIYAKGKSDQKQKAAIDDLKAANDIRKTGADARAGAAVSPDRLHQSDGWKRDQGRSL